MARSADPYYFDLETATNNEAEQRSHWTLADYSWDTVGLVVKRRGARGANNTQGCIHPSGVAVAPGRCAHGASAVPSTYGTWRTAPLRGADRPWPCHGTGTARAAWPASAAWRKHAACWSAAPPLPRPNEIPCLVHVHARCTASFPQHTPRAHPLDPAAHPTLPLPRAVCLQSRRPQPAKLPVCPAYRLSSQGLQQTQPAARAPGPTRLPGRTATTTTTLQRH
jgi:hypothetical protein